MARNARPSLQDYPSCTLHDPGHSLRRSILRTTTTTTTTHKSAHLAAAPQKYFLPHPTEPGRFITVTANMAVPNFSRGMTASGKASADDRALPTAQHLRSSPSKAFGVKRWNGETRSIGDWDGLRRACELINSIIWCIG